jgi:hypothetical protein
MGERWPEIVALASPEQCSPSTSPLLKVRSKAAGSLESQSLFTELFRAHDSVRSVHHDVSLRFCSPKSLALSDEIFLLNHDLPSFIDHGVADAMGSLLVGTYNG